MDGAEHMWRWFWLAWLLALDLWDDEIWHELAENAVKLARDAGASLGGFGAVTQGIDATTMPGALDLRDGRMPSADDEIAIDAASADELGRAVDDETGVLLDGAVETYRITGLIDPPAAVRDLAGSTTVVFSDAAAERLYGTDGATYIAVRSDDGDLAALGGALTRQLGSGVEVLTVDELVTDSVAQVSDFLSFLTRGLLVFAGAALLVGAIIIYVWVAFRGPG